jgi:hypothetical protein
MLMKLIKIVLAEVEGEAYAGSFEVSDGTLTVRSAYSQKSTQITGMDVTDLARGMLRELVREEIRRGLHAKRSGNGTPRNDLGIRSKFEPDP